MKSLKEYILQDLEGIELDMSKIPSNTFENEEFYWHLILEYSRKYIFESYSFVQEICKLSPKIIQKIQNNLDKNRIEFKKLNASFFKTLTIDLVQNNKLHQIVNGDGDIDSSDKENIFIEIEFNKNDFDKFELKDTIEHELVHLYQNYHHIKNNKSLRQQIDKRFYDSYTDIEDLSNPIDKLKFIIYLFDPDECTSKIQGMLAKIDGRKLSNPKKVFELVSQEGYYKEMKKYYEAKDKLEEIIPGLPECYRIIFPKWKSLTREQILRKLEKYIYKNWKIFLNKLSKACVGKSIRKIK